MVMEKNYRLKDSDEIGSIVKNRQRVYSELYTIYYVANQQETKIAVVCGKKVGKAHARNYMKRAIREIVRPRMNELNNIHAVIVTKDKAVEAPYVEKKQNLNKLINMMIERIKK